MKCLVCNREKAIYYFNVKRNILNKEIVFRICDDCGEDVDVEDDRSVDKLLEKEPEIIHRTHDRPMYNDYTKYGLLGNEYNDMFIKQKGRCAICNTHQVFLKRSLSVDHCHTTGKVRGLLCGSCNSAIGLLKENTKTIENAIKYLIDSKN